MYVFWEIGHLKNNEGIEWPTKSSRSFEVSQSGTKSIWKKVPSREAALFASAFLKYFQASPELSLPFHILKTWIQVKHMLIIYFTIFVDFYSTKYATHIYVPSFKKDQGMWVIEYWLKIDLEVKLFKNPNKK